MTRILLLLLLALAQPAHADGLTGKTAKDTYGDLLQMSNGNAGLNGTPRPVLDGKGNASALQLSTGAVQLSGPLAFTGVLHPGLTLNRLTSAQRDALTPAAGMLIYNTTSNRAEAYNGTAWVGANGGSVTSLGLAASNGITASLANPTTTPAITLGLGDITPNSVAAAGAVTGANLSGTNTGDQSVTLTGAVISNTITGASLSVPTTLALNSVTAPKIAAGACAANVGTLGGDLSGTLPNPAVTQINGLAPAAVATSGSYPDLINRPTLGTAAAQNSTAFATAAQGTKADNALAAANNLSDVGSVATARANLGLGTAATQATGAFLQAASNLSDLPSAAAARANLGLGTAATQASGTFLQASNNLSDLPNVATARTDLGLGALATLNSASLSSNVSGTLPIANGGSGQTTANAALNAFLPSQASASGKFLASNGTNAGWGAAIPATTWASIPAAAAAGAYAFEFVTDVGANGCLFESTGSAWRPASGVCNLGSSGAAITATGTGSVVETAFVTVPIPANLLGANGQLLVNTYWSFTNSANTKTPRIRFGGASGTIFQGAGVTTNATQQVITRIANAGATNAQKGFPSGTTSGTGTNSTAGVTSSVDTTAATSLVISGSVTTSGEVITLESYSVELIAP